jgi:hypothetical protein
MDNRHYQPGATDNARYQVQPGTVRKTKIKDPGGEKTQAEQEIGPHADRDRGKTCPASAGPHQRWQRSARDHRSADDKYVARDLLDPHEHPARSVPRLYSDSIGAYQRKVEQTIPAGADPARYDV